jgi:hypothetical protein
VPILVEMRRRERVPFEGESRFEAADGVLEAVVQYVNEDRPPDLPAGLSKDVLKLLVEAAHWASLTTEEGLPADFSLLRTEEVGAASFATPVALTADAIARLSPASRVGGLGLVVQSREGTVRIVGMASAAAPAGLTVSANSPAVVTVHTPAGTAAVFERGRAFFLGGSSRWNLLEFVGRVLGDVPHRERVRFGDALMRIVSGVREERRGGTLLIVEGEGWKRAVVAPIPYAFSRPFTPLGDLLRELRQLEAGEPESPGRRGPWETDEAEARAGALRAITRELGTVAGVDGATVLTRELDLVAFGAMITAQESARSLDQVLELEVGTAFQRLVTLGDRLGTRHQSAARFVAAVRDALAVVVSADGPVSVFAWSEETSSIVFMSHAERWLF